MIDSIDTLYPLIKTTPNMADLPDNIKHLIHYGQLIAAHQLFIYLHADVDSEKVPLPSHHCHCQHDSIVTDSHTHTHICRTLDHSSECTP